MGQFQKLKNLYKKTEKNSSDYLYNKLEVFKPQYISATEEAQNKKSELETIKSYKLEFLTVREFSSKLSKEYEQKRNEVQLEIEALRFARSK
ncbi:hypothetical protein J6G99_05935 [bacterium]|nr:hypothetical protein [bacterium]